MRRLLMACAALSLLPVGAVLVVAEPVAAATTGYDQVTTTAVVAGVRTEGTVGASGGLVTLDSGSAQVRAALDDGPSGSVLAAPYEPGVLVRTVVGQVNTGAGEQVLDVPDAEATYPGTPHSSKVETVPGTTAGPVAVVGGTATAEAGARRVAGTATGASFAIAGVVTAGGSASEVRLEVDPAAGHAVSRATSAVGSVDVGGVLLLTDVVARAVVTATGEAHTATQELTIGGASVAGQAVSVGNEGVTAVGTPLIPGQSLEDATAQANALLASAGISVRTIGGRTAQDDRSAVADTGGVLVSVTQDAAGLGANTVTLVIGSAVLTVTDTPAQQLVTDPCEALGVSCPPASGQPGTPGSTSTTFIPGTPGGAGPGGADGPLVVPTQPVGYELAGRRFSPRAALLAFGAWQLVSLGVPTLYALVDRRRRLRLSAGTP